jgi:hypothetical protein
VEGVLRIVDEIARSGMPLEYLTGNTPLSDQTFRDALERSQRFPFSPRNFRRYRLSQLRRADAFLYIRTAMSESGAFEVCYNVYNEPRAPMFFAVWKHAPIKTTLLRELDDVCDVTYREFEHPEELRADMQRFFYRVAQSATAAPGIGTFRTSSTRLAWTSRRAEATFPSIAKRRRSLRFACDPSVRPSLGITRTRPEWRTACAWSRSIPGGRASAVRKCHGSPPRAAHS